MYNIISKNRNFIMGIAIIWVALYHLPVHNTVPVFGYLQDVGYGGVDIFFFLSGMGVASSLSKNSDSTSFLIRRMKRLLPSYLPFICFWIVFKKVTYQIFMTEIAGNLTMSGWWNQDANQFNWYIDAIVLFYILAPYIYGLISKAKRPLLSSILMLCLSLIISVGFWHGILLMAITRLPLFILGICMFILKEHKIFTGRFAVIFWNVIMVAGFLLSYYLLKIQGISDGMEFIDRWHYGLFWYPFLLIAPGLSMDLGFLGNILGRIKIIDMFGIASFEIFLWHIFIFETAQSKSINGALIWTGLFIAAFATGYGYNRLVEFIKKKLIKDN